MALLNFRWNQVSLWQHRIKRNLFLNLYREGKNITSLFPPAAWDKNVWHLQAISSVWGPLAFLPVTLSILYKYPPDCLLEFTKVLCFYHASIYIFMLYPPLITCSSLFHISPSRFTLSVISSRNLLWISRMKQVTALHLVYCSITHDEYHSHAT